MENTGYAARNHGCDVKRYCRTMDLRNNPELIAEYKLRHSKDKPELIAEYKLRHSKEKIWPEILEGIRSVGILEMEIYILGTRLFMIVETPLDFDWDSAMEKLAGLPRQQEWEDYMSIFQCMERMFYLY